LKITKTDIFLILILLLIPLFFLSGKNSGEKKLYLISEKEKKPIPLVHDKILLDNGKVIIEVTDEGARFLESNCPNHICIKAGWVTECGQAAVCVPNKYAIIMECREEAYDAISQ